MSDKGADGRLLNGFTWSFSRHSTFNECQKRYWYIYYGAWEGWPLYPRDPRPRLDPLAAYLYTLKNMQHFPMFIGSIVHSVIEKALKEHRKSKHPLNLDALQKQGQKLLDKGIEDSEKELWRKSPKHRSNLFEHYYSKRYGDEGLSATSIEKGREKIARCLSHWFSSPIVEKLILGHQAEYLSIEDLDSFLLDGIFKIFVVIDFAIKWALSSSTSAIILFDWKTGKETDKTIDQLYSYALYANKIWGYSYEQLILSPFYLDSGHYEKIGYRQEEALSQEKIHATEDFIRKSCESMLQLVSGEDSLELKAQRNTVEVTDCSYTDQRYRCGRCPFRELCEAVNYEQVANGELRSAAAELSVGAKKAIG